MSQADNQQMEGAHGAYWSHLRDGRFMMQRSRSTGEYVFPPRMIAPGSGATDLEWVEASGQGTVYSVTTISRPPKHGGDFDIVLVDLAEGVRILSRVTDREPGDVKIGDPLWAEVKVPDFGPYAGTEQPIVTFTASAPEGESA